VRLHDNDEKIAAFGWVASDSDAVGITDQTKEYDASMDAPAEVVTETKMNEGRYSYTFVCGLCKKISHSPTADSTVTLIQPRQNTVHSAAAR
jgi:hypothetical protein